MLKNYSFRKGFSAIELLVGMGIFSLLLYLSSVFYSRIQRNHLFSDNIWQLAAILREAQNKAASGIVSDDNHLRYGIVFTTSNYREFATVGNFNERDQGYDLVTALPTDLQFTNLSLPNTCLQNNDCIIFSTANGTPSARGQITIEDTTQNISKVISINEEGKVSY
jgi:prepilin-type N-terminal cleavage/methylation domain-containing protein